MEKCSDEDVMSDSLRNKDSDDDTSFVTKVKSRVSGLFNSSFSRLFGNQGKAVSTIRRRDDEEEGYEHQPPRKKARGQDDFYLQSNYSNHTTQNICNNSLSNASTTLFTNFAEPVAGPSGIKSRKAFHKNSTSVFNHTEVNGEKDSDSGESTSGYSSMPRLCHQEIQPSVEAKKTPLFDRTKEPLELKTDSESKSVGFKKHLNSTAETPSRSLFAERSLSPQAKNTSLSSRRPSFNTSNFGSPNFVDRTITTNRIINSPFYSGPTIYGGASAYGKQQSINESRRQQLKNSFLVKPVNKSNNTNPCTSSLSKTARRILDTLEQYSSSMSDAKKIPLPTKVERQGMLSKYIGTNPYRIRESRVSSNKELLVPTMPELLQMKQRQRLQETTDKIRQIATSSTAQKETDYKIVEDNEQKQHRNKMKAKVSSVRSKAPQIEVLEDVVLKPVELTLPDNKLPKFDLVIPPPDCLKGEKRKIRDISTCIESKPKEKATIEVIPEKKEGGVAEFTFSMPLVIADNLKSIVAINNFKFSEPLSKRVCVPEKILKKPMNNGNVKNAQNIVDSIKTTKDPIMEKFKAPEGSWECPTCMIRNKAEASKCVACETTKQTDSAKPAQKPSLPGFGIQFTKKPDEWDCKSCLVRNKSQHDKCVACATPKESTAPKTNGFGKEFLLSSDQWECSVCLVRNPKDSTRCVACETVRNQPKPAPTLADKFKPPPGSWECQTCLVMNKGELTKCVACETQRGGVEAKPVRSDNKFGAQFRPPSDTWECETCLIRNKDDLKTCAACQTPREKIFVKSEPLKKPSDKWECPTCMVRNENALEKCPCCETTKPGVTLIGKNTVNMFNFGVNTTKFNFGIPQDKSGVSPASTISFGTPTTSTPVINSTISAITTAATTTPVFSFGMKPETKETVSKNDLIKNEALPVAAVPPKPVEAPKTAPVFSFGAAPAATGKTEPVAAGFKFGAPANAAQPEKAAAPNFAFGNSAPLLSKSQPANAAPAPAFKFEPLKPAAVAPPMQPAAADKGEDKPKMAMFSFGKANAGPAPVFNFGSAAADFGAAKLPPPKANPVAGFAFKADPPTNFSVAPAVAPAPTKNGGFNFGSAAVANNQAAVFSFGASQNASPASMNQAQPVTGGFNFSAPAAPSVGGFNFSAPTFDANVKPFNFTGGSIPTFAAAPTEGAAPVRKYKKAVRRAAQR